MIVQLFPQIGHDTLTDIVHEVGLPVVEYSLDEKESNDSRCYEEQHPPIFIHQDSVHCGLSEPGGSTLAETEQNHAGHGQDKSHPVRFNVLQQPFVQFYGHLETGKGLRPLVNDTIQDLCSSLGCSRGPQLLLDLVQFASDHG